MSQFAIRLSMLTIGAAALVVFPSVTAAQAETGKNQMHKHQRQWRHHDSAAWSVGPRRPVVGSYSVSEPVCPAIGKSFDCKIWPPPFADDPDRKTSRY